MATLLMPVTSSMIQLMAFVTSQGWVLLQEFGLDMAGNAWEALLGLAEKLVLSTRVFTPRPYRS